MEPQTFLLSQDFRHLEERGSMPNPLMGLVHSSVSQERFECFDCHKAYFTFSGLAKHRQLHCEWQCHKYFCCRYCDKEYVSLGALKMHIRTHTLPCVCKLCGKAFSRPWLLQGHIRTHTGTDSDVQPATLFTFIHLFHELCLTSHYPIFSYPLGL
jgi:uncharacterized Zn-finger protein